MSSSLSHKKRLGTNSQFCTLKSDRQTKCEGSAEWVHVGNVSGLLFYDQHTVQKTVKKIRNIPYLIYILRTDTDEVEENRKKTLKKNKKWELLLQELHKVQDK